MPKAVSARIANMPLSAIKRMELLASKQQNVVSLAQGIPSFQSSDRIREFVKAAIERDLVDKYSLSPGISSLREIISRRIYEETGQFYNPEEEIIVTTGAMEALSATLLTLISSGDEVIVPTPCYVSYFNQIRMAGGLPIEVPLTESNWQLDLNALKKAFTPRTKAILLCHPNNPTGQLYRFSDLKKLVELVIEKDVYLIVDEVYKYFIFEQSQKCISLAHIPEIRPHLIGIFGLSKTYSLTGWRVGYIYGDKQIMPHILKMHDNLVTCAPVVSQYAAMAALSESTESIRPRIDELRLRRDYLCEALEKTGLFQFLIPKATYYLFARVNVEVLPPELRQSAPDFDSELFCIQLLGKIGLNLVPGKAFGKIGQNFVRFCFARSMSDIEEALNRLQTLTIKPLSRTMVNV